MVTTTTVICADALPFLRSLHTDSVGAVVTSPPYNLGEGHGNKSGGNHLHKLRAGYDTTDDTMPHREYAAWQRACLAEMVRVCSPEGCVMYNTSWRTRAGRLDMRRDIIPNHAPVRQLIIWDRQGSLCHSPMAAAHMYEVIYAIPGGEAFRPSDTARHWGDIWSHRPERHNPHPAPMPLEIAYRMTEYAAGHRGGIVLDPFCGSGTTLLAALRMGLPSLGVDRSYRYCAGAMARARKREGQYRLWEAEAAAPAERLC